MKGRSEDVSCCSASRSQKFAERRSARAGWALCLLLAIHPVQARASDGIWTRIDLTGGPSGRESATGVFDVANDRLVVFGGGFKRSNSSPITDYDEVWTYSETAFRTDGNGWTLLAPMGTAPSPRHEHTAIYDPVRERMIVFGGSTFDGRALDDTWALSLSGAPEWNRITDEVAPPARYGHSAIYDAARDRMIVFGGGGSDTWSFDLASDSWNPIATQGTPPAPIGHTATYDPIRDRMLVFGGEGAGASGIWSLSLTGPAVWTFLERPGDGYERHGHNAFYDPIGDRLVLFGGWYHFLDVTATSLSTSSGWSVELPEHADAGLLHEVLPEPRMEAAGAYDPIRHRFIVFGGMYPDQRDARATYSNTWTYSLGSRDWLRVGLPRMRYPGVVYDTGADRLILLGRGNQPPFHLRFEPGLSIAPLRSPLPDVRRDGHSAIVSPSDQTLIVYGGSYATTPDPAWGLSLQDNSTWTVLDAGSDRPPPRSFHSAIWDPIRNRMIVFGGNEPTVPWADRNDVWSLARTGTGSWSWTRETPQGAPPSPRNGHRAVYDPIRDRMLVLTGARPPYQLLPDTWALSLSKPMRWTQLSPSGIPPQRVEEAIWDPVRKRVVVFDGATAWALDPSGSGRWTALGTTGDPPPSHFSVARGVYDPVRKAFVLLAGSTVSLLSWADTTAVDSPPDVEWTVNGSDTLHVGSDVTFSWQTWDDRPDIGVEIVLHRDELSSESLMSSTNRAGTFAWRVSGPETEAAVFEIVVSDDAGQRTRAFGVARAILEPSIAPPSRFQFAITSANPFRDRLELQYELSRSGPVSIELFDVRGRRVAVLESGIRESGIRSTAWSPGKAIGPGIYLLLFEGDGRRLMRRVVFAP